MIIHGWLPAFVADANSECVLQFVLQWENSKNKYTGNVNIWELYFILLQCNIKNKLNSTHYNTVYDINWLGLSTISTKFNKTGTTYFQILLSHFLVDFYNSSTNGNRSEYSTIICRYRVNIKRLSLIYFVVYFTSIVTVFVWLDFRSSVTLGN